jgi:hypothetical protein
VGLHGDTVTSLSAIKKGRARAAPAAAARVPRRQQLRPRACRADGNYGRARAAPAATTAARVPRRRRAGMGQGHHAGACSLSVSRAHVPSLFLARARDCSCTMRATALTCAGRAQAGQPRRAPAGWGGDTRAYLRVGEVPV